MDDLNKLFSYEGKIYTMEGAKKEIFDYIDFQTDILEKEIDNIEKEYEKV